MKRFRNTMHELSPQLAPFARWDQRLVAMVQDIKLLSSLSWPREVQLSFLQEWRAGNPRLPEVNYERQSHADTLRALDTLMAELDTHHPLGRYLHSTARSYHDAARLLEARGTAAVTARSLSLYGKPGDSIAGGTVHNIDAARHFIEVTAAYEQEYSLHEADYCLSAEVLQRELSERIGKVIDRHDIEVVIDENLASKAAAGATRIRLRAGTPFSEYDLNQLLEHEAFVHSLTAINGREQPHFRSLSLGAPRTTGTQEGLATFAELVTGAVDIRRLQRIALRIIAIDMALRGADFIDVFRYFLDAGQTEVESFNSAMRIYRGAPVTGGSAFTKDTVYLHGLMEVHTFFRWALKHNRLRLCRHLFAGRMTVGDVVRLAPLFEAGDIAAPMYLPPWMLRTNGLAAYLAFSVFANRIRISELGAHYSFADDEAEPLR
ncbi:flavohemoglobin expression-modulating QEGLA motif protein [Parahaliea aestuarii]|nr:flavohemoglobin expression-modulating QEGLA motif protein [Parahaliea aestuarii]